MKLIGMKEAAKELNITYHAFRYLWNNSSTAKPPKIGRKAQTYLFRRKELISWYHEAKAAPRETREQNKTVSPSGFDNRLAMKFLSTPLKREFTMSTLANKYRCRATQTTVVHCEERHGQFTDRGYKI